MISDDVPKINWRLARQMWRNGKDTAFIAQELGASEARIYNGLAKGRGLNYEMDMRKSPSPSFNIVRGPA
jgi:hypothetical protein